MKIISGLFKGRIIKGYNVSGTRPTMDRVKESIFGIIQNNIQDSLCLDIFCGSGNLGIEAISNGAKYCYFIDSNKIIIDVLKDNLSTLKIKDKSNIIILDYKKALLSLKKNNLKFNIIFADPPYDLEVMEELINLIIKYDLLADSGLLVLEYQKDKLQEYYGNIHLIKCKKYSDKYVNFYQK